MAASDSDDDVRGPSSRGGMMVTRPKQRELATWEASASKPWALQDAADGDLEGALGGIEEAAKRKRFVPTSTSCSSSI